VFTFLVGQHAEEEHDLKSLACSNGGNFTVYLSSGMHALDYRCVWALKIGLASQFISLNLAARPCLANSRIRQPVLANSGSGPAQNLE